MEGEEDEMEGEKEKGWRRTYTFLNRRGEKDGSLDRQGVDCVFLEK